jgi:hypothetical protein
MQEFHLILQLFSTQKNQIAHIYNQPLDKLEEHFKTLTKSLTDIRLTTIKGSLEDFPDIIKALLQSTEISMPG